jgi:hypothetical protein
MKKEEMNVGDIFYKADVIDPLDREERVIVRKFEVTQCGEKKFQVQGERWTEQGFWTSHLDFISSLQRTPDEAVAYLARKVQADLTKAKERQARQYARTQEVLQLIAEWKGRNK